MFSICRGKQDKIVLELLSTEKSYVDDLKIVLSGYKQKVIYDRGKVVSITLKLFQMASSKISAKAPIIFGNVDEIEKFHSETLLPELENCNKR